MGNENDEFDNLSNALDIDFDKDETLDVKISKYQERKNALVEKVHNESDIEDAEYMRFELKSLIMGGLNILDKLDQDIKIGSKTRAHEVYFMGINSIRDTIKELRELNKTIVDVDEDKNNKTQNNLTVNYNMNGKELLNMIKDAKQNSNMNDIKAEFKIDGAESNFDDGSNVKKDMEKKNKNKNKIL